MTTKDESVAMQVAAFGRGVTLEACLRQAYEAGVKAARLPAGLVSYHGTYEGPDAAAEFVFVNGIRVVIPFNQGPPRY